MSTTGPGPSKAGPSKAGPSKAGYWVGGGVVVVGVVGAVLWFVLGFLSFSHTVDDFQRVPANGKGEVTFSDAGGYVIYYEAPGADDGELPAGQAQLTPSDSDEPVPLDTYGSSLTYDSGDHSGQAVLTVEIERPGSYVLESTSDGAGELAVGRSVGNTLVTTVVGSLALGGLGVVVGAVILIVTFVRRRNARPRSAPSYRYPPPPPPQSHAFGAPVGL